MKPALTERQAEMLQTIRDFTASHGYPPTVRELGAAAGGITNNAIQGHIKALIRKGHLTQTPGLSRSLRPVEAGQKLAWVATADRLPEADCRCLVYGEATGFTVQAGRYVINDGRFIFNDQRYALISHWFPWPEPPEDAGPSR